MGSMKKSLFWILPLFFFVAFYFVQINNALALQREQLQNSIEQKTKELQELKSKIQATQNKIGETQSQTKTLKKELQRIDKNIVQLKLNIKISEISIEKIKLEIESFQYSVADTQTKILRQIVSIGQILRIIEQNDREGFFLGWLKNKSLAEGFAAMQNAKNLNQSLAAKLKNLKEAQEELKQNLILSNQKKSQLELEESNLKHRQGIVQDQKKDQQFLLAQTKNQEKVYQRQLKELEEIESKISAEVEEIEKQLRMSFDPSLVPTPRPGVLAMPITGLVTQPYGKTFFAKTAYKTGFHNGIDFKADLGTPVFAAEGGKVTAIGDNGNVQFGKFIIVQHDNNLTTLYSHLSNNRLVSEGNSVSRGQLVGYSGHSGYSTGPHLHFGVYVSQTFIMKFFPLCNCGLVPVGATLDPSIYLL